MNLLPFCNCPYPTMLRCLQNAKNQKLLTLLRRQNAYQVTIDCTDLMANHNIQTDKTPHPPEPTECIPSDDWLHRTQGQPQHPADHRCCGQPQKISTCNQGKLRRGCRLRGFACCCFYMCLFTATTNFFKRALQPVHESRSAHLHHLHHNHRHHDQSIPSITSIPEHPHHPHHVRAAPPSPPSHGICYDLGSVHPPLLQHHLHLIASLSEHDSRTASAAPDGALSSDIAPKRSSHCASASVPFAQCPERFGAIRLGQSASGR